MAFFSSLTRAALCCLSIGFLVGGIVSVVIARGNVHEHKVEQYKQAVEHWKSVRGRFQGISDISLSIKDSEADKKMVLKHATGPNPLAENEDSYELPEYEASWYQARGSEDQGTTDTSAEFLPPASFSNLVNISSMARWGQIVHFELMVDGSPLEIGPVPIVRTMAHYEPEGVYDRCTDKEGIHTLSGVCWVYSRLSHLCVQIMEDGDGGWQLARRAPGLNFSYGCKYRGERKRWEAAEYSTVPIIRMGIGLNMLAPNSSAEFEDFSVEVRSSQDPYLKAIELTHGSLAFGMTSLEEDVLGIVLIVMGGVFALANVTAACATGRRHNDDDEREREQFGVRAQQRKEAQNSRKARAQGKQHQKGNLNAETIGMRYAVEPQQDPPDGEEDADRA